MKTLQVLEPEKLTPEEIAALRRIGFDVSFQSVLDAWFQQQSVSPRPIDVSIFDLEPVITDENYAEEA